MGSKTASRIAGVKLSGIILSFLLPILVLGYFLTVQIRDDIAFTARVLDGVALNRAAMPVLFDASAGHDLPPDDQVLLELGPALAGRLKLDAEFGTLKALLAKPGAEPAAILDAAMLLVVPPPGKTDMIYDPSPESHFLASLITGSLPNLLRDYQDVARMAALAAQRPAGSLAREQVLISLGRLQGSIARLSHGLQNARAVSGDVAYDRAIQYAEELSRDVGQLALQRPREGAAAAGYAGSFSDLLGGLSGRVSARARNIWLLAVSHHGAALEKRHSDLRASLAMMLMFSASACSLGLAAAIFMFRSTLRKLDGVEAARAAAERARHEADQMAERLSEINDDMASLNSELSGNMRKLRDAQDELLRKGRMSQLDQLTATVAHELRNPLGAVRASAYLLQRKVRGKGLDVEAQIERINKGVIRCDDIIGQLLDFSQAKSLQCDLLDLDLWLEKLVAEEAEKLPETIVMECNLGLAGRKLRFDPGRLGRVIVNLLSNASEALVGRAGDPAISATTGPRIVLDTRLTGKGAEISVSDNGPGISQENLARIREPLFTTKNFGTGLGLPAVEKILELHGGRLEIQSSSAKGACFTAILPAEAA